MPKKLNILAPGCAAVSFRNVTGNGNMFADQHPNSYAPEAHDFTAGAASAYGAYDYNAPVAPAAGYVDLQRANSGGLAPVAPLSRGLTVSGGHTSDDYNSDEYFSSPEGNQAYGHGHQDAYEQNAYGGYDAYGQQQQPQHYAADPYAPREPYAQGRGYEGGRY